MKNPSNYLNFYCTWQSSVTIADQTLYSGMLNVSGTSMDCGSNDISSISVATLPNLAGDKKPYISTTGASCPNAGTNSNFKLY